MKEVNQKERGEDEADEMNPQVDCKDEVFTVRRYALHGLSYRNSVCLSVCLSVRPSHSWTVSTWFDPRS